MKNNSNFKNYLSTAIACLTILSSNGFASLAVDNSPSTIITDKLSELDRPEGIAFTPCGKYLAVANLFSNAITFYKQLENNKTVYENIPAFSIKGKKSKLNFPHDVAFSPNGKHLAVANRHGNSITIYARNPANGMYSCVPLAIIQGQSSQLATPSSVKYSPVNNIISVANTEGHSITMYRYKGDVYEQTPYQIIRDTSDVLSRVNSLDFSADGELLAAANIDTHSVVIYQRIQDSDIYTSHPIGIIKGEDTHLCYPHSVSFHPSNNYLVVSNAEGRKNINIFQIISANFSGSKYSHLMSLEVTQMYDESTIHLVEKLHQKGGCKGVSFSLDGTSLAVTQNLTADGIHVPYSISMLLIFPLKDF